MLATLHEDLRFAMPPEPGLFVGRDEIVEYWAPSFDQEGFGRMTGVVTRANMQPAVACYRQLPGESEFKPLALDVIRIEDGIDRRDHHLPVGALPRLRPARDALRQGSNLRTMTTAATAGSAQERELLERARGGSEDAFRDLVEPHRRELQAHCYRMLGSVYDAEDAVQDALLRAWRALPRFEPRHSLRAWLYKIATNVSLDAIARRPKRVLPPDYVPSTDGGQTAGAPAVESVWVEPYPDEQLAVEDGYAAPEARYEQREGVELAFVAALQHLPPRQRAALILREVLGFSAKETADSLDTTPQSVNSALQRARATVDEQPAGAELSRRRCARSVTSRCARSSSASATRCSAATSRPSSRCSPRTRPGRCPRCRPGTAATTSPASCELGPMSGEWRWRHLPAHANGQAAIGAYVWHEGEQAYLAFALNVFTFEGDRIKEVTSFLNRAVKGTDPEYYARFPEQPIDPKSNLAYFERFGLPERLD